MSLSGKRTRLVEDTSPRACLDLLATTYYFSPPPSRTRPLTCTLRYAPLQDADACLNSVHSTPPGACTDRNSWLPLVGTFHGAVGHLSRVGGLNHSIIHPYYSSKSRPVCFLSWQPGSLTPCANASLNQGLNVTCKNPSISDVWSRGFDHSTRIKDVACCLRDYDSFDHGEEDMLPREHRG